jgi:hypothetical protein
MMPGVKLFQKCARGTIVDFARGLRLAFQGCVLEEGEERTLSVAFALSDLDANLSDVKALIFAYDEKQPNPGWILSKAGALHQPVL